MVKENAGDATRFRGVRKLKSGNYGAEISIKSKTKWLGTFKTAEEAARRYDAAAHELHGVKAKLNFPHELLAESEVYPTRVNKTSTTSEESSSNPNMNGCSRQNNSAKLLKEGHVNDISGEKGKEKETSSAHSKKKGVRWYLLEKLAYNQERRAELDTDDYQIKKLLENVTTSEDDGDSDDDFSIISEEEDEEVVRNTPLRERAPHSGRSLD